MIKYITGFLVVGAGLVAASTGDVRYGNFDGERFHNQALFRGHGFLEFLTGRRGG